jgi:glycosyltransferase involved in cell wall biosynthesis
VLLTDREPTAIAAKLEELLDSPEERHLLGQSARILARCDYSLPAMGKALHHLYREIVKN